MLTYKIEVATGEDISAGTINFIYIVLVGVNGETPKHKLDHWGRDFIPGAVDKYRIDSNEDIGDILYVRLYKEFYLVSDDWFCKYVRVISPGGDTYHFPCYQWLSGTTTQEIPEGKAKILVNGMNSRIVQQRKSELEKKRETHRWRYYSDGLPYCIDVDDVVNLPLNEQYSTTKNASFLATSCTTAIELKLKGYNDCRESWTNLTDIERIFLCYRSKNSESVAKMWKEDAFFGYQYLNGVNPLQIRKCFHIPENFPVDDELVASSLGTCTSLQEELENGNLFLADYKILEGIPANKINGQKQHFTAPLCLLWKNPEDDLVPIAIQLGQTPGEDTPIFLPSDPEWDWTIAKIWVRNADFQVQETVTHLLFTHLFAEAFSIATTRHLPMSHPIYKVNCNGGYSLTGVTPLTSEFQDLKGVNGITPLIIPHVRYTLAINTLGRERLINAGGSFEKHASIGVKGLQVLLKRAMEELTYDSLCLPDDIENRAVESIPNYYYRDDGMKIWLAIERFASDIVHFYYEYDESVSQDPELQAWVEEIYKKGFLENQNSGIPSSLETKVELIKYLTMVIFTCSAKHAAVNSGQFDFYFWMPNCPTTMREPPPSVKGITTVVSVLETLPQVDTTTSAMSVIWVLSNEPKDQRHLGNFPDEHFTEDMPKKFIQDFQCKLSEISAQIKERNKSMDLTYLYLDPEKIENSVSI